MDGYKISKADFSLCKKYRYSLKRVWDEEKKKVLFICLNPSTATETQDDPTIRRCVGFAKDWGYGGLYITNLFAFRATDPKNMKKETFPVGRDNNDWILELHERCDLTIAAWGTHGRFLRRDRIVLDLLRSGPALLDSSPVHCLAITKNGLPKHPLYLKRDLKPFLYQGL